MPIGISAYVPLATKTLTATATTVTFSSISQSYRDLVLIMTAKEVASNGAAMSVRFNTLSTAIYSMVQLRGNGASATASMANGQTSFNLDLGSGMDVTLEKSYKVDIVDYSVTNKHKTILSRANRQSNNTSMMAQICQTTAAVTTIALFPSVGSFAIGSTFTLYGVSA